MVTWLGVVNLKFGVLPGHQCVMCHPLLVINFLLVLSLPANLNTVLSSLGFVVVMLDINYCTE